MQLDRMPPKLTVVVPCLNEEESLAHFFEALIPSLERCVGADWSIIIVDDGSTDGTYDLVNARHQRDPRIGSVSLSRNFGHQPAINAGLAYANADYVAVMDADLQDPPKVLEQLYAKVAVENYDVCLGVRGRRNAPWLLNVAYKTFYRLMRNLADHPWPIDAGDFSVFNRRVQEALLRLPEHDRMLRGLRSWVGFKTASVSYERPARDHGEAKYNFWRLLALAVSAMAGFTTAPLRLASLLGFGMSVFTLIVGLLFLINRLMPRFSLFGYYVGADPGTTTILLYFSLVSSMLFFCLGIIGEYMVILVHETKRRPSAIVARHTVGLSGRIDTGHVMFADRS